MTTLMAADALVVGEALVDVVHDAAGEVAEHPGGSPANVAVGLARLGRPTTLLTDLGEDRYGDLLADHLSAEGVGLLLPRRPGAATSYATARLRPDGSAAYSFAVDWRLPAIPAPTGPRIVHTGSLAAVAAPGADVVENLLRALADRATISYDLNIRPSVMGEAELPARVARIAALADIVKASDEDLAALAPGVPLEEAARRLLDLGPAAVVVTRGGDGAWCLTRSGATAVPAPPVVVADTIGAGDSFCAAIIDRLWDHDVLGAPARPRLRSMRQADWSDVLGYAAAAAAVTVSRPGADPPTRAEIAAPLSRR
ncbi:carbohydrate kinase family protein [Nocardioides sp.]|uniref:carbohydrate kinase family protein n=1 Tax=Nocardioides sp. TaxID=35761 RepID=UPI0039E3D5E5